ncbi:hypothetical protein [Methanocalculus sp.]|uniref:hypothetical protein n=1 Tax=Methanocalculus sp. TaxID=2004547 RepID=UPI0027266059|nr:hypothetical protein [Methanocalculus sp.]MDO8842626.1 hypothetical protein [Methanocalculus sp.]
MRIVRSVRHKVCADGSFMKEFLISEPVPEGFFLFLSHFGTVESLPALGEGFYKFEKTDWFSIKGFTGDTMLEVRFKKEVMNLTVDFLFFLFTSYKDGDYDLVKLKMREENLGRKICEFLYGPSGTK